jgi:predicted transcriptional regulator
MEIDSVFYLYLASKLKNNSEDGEMSITDLKWNMFQWKIPEVIKPIIIKEMEKLGLIEQIDKRTIKFLRNDFDIKNIGKYAERAGVF